MLKKEEVRKIVDASLEKLPNLSPSAMKIVELANDLSASPKDLMNIIKIDPVLTGKILSLVNSTYFSLPQKITSLNRALILLGFNTIKNIALTSAFVEATGNQEKNDYFDLKELWRHMLAVGVTSKLMAKAANQPQQLLEEFFIAGLLHDVGDMMLMKYAPAEYYEISLLAESKGLAVADVCRDTLGFSSADVGRRIAERWRLGEGLMRVIADQHAEGADDTYLAKVVRLADRHCRAKAYGFVRDRVGCEIGEADLAAVQLTPAAYADVAQSVPDEIERAKVFLEAKP